MQLYTYNFFIYIFYNMNKSPLIFLSLLIIISVFISIANLYKPPVKNKNLKDFDADFHLEEFILNNEPDQQDISEFPITEAFQVTTDLDKVYNKWELIRGKLSNALEKRRQAVAIAMKQENALKEDKKETDALLATVLQGNSKTNAMGVFTDLEVMQKTGDKYLKNIKSDLQSLEKETAIATGNTTAAIRLITTGQR